MMKFLFGEGWWMAWYAVVWLVTLAFVGVPVYALIRDAVPKPAGPASLGTVFFAMGMALILGVLTLINGTVGLKMAGLGWIATILISVAAATGVTIGIYLAAATVGDKGGYAWSGVLTAACLVVFIANLAALAQAREAVSRPVALEAAPA